MADVASLGIAVDSSQAKAATTDLNSLAAAAKAAGLSTEQFAASGIKSESALKAYVGMAGRMNVSLGEYLDRTRGVTSATDAATQSQQRLNAATSASGAAAAAGSMSLVRMVSSYNSISLILQGVTSAVSAYFLLTATNGPALEKSLEEQARLIGLVKDAYRSATDQAGKFFQSSREVVELQLKLNINDLQTKLRDQIGDVLKQAVGFTPTVDIMGSGFGVPDLNSANVGPFQKAAEDLYKSLGEGAPAIERFQKAIADLGNANPELAAAAGRYLEFAKAAAESADKFRQAESALAIVQGKSSPDDRSRLGLPNPKPIRDVADAYDRAADSIRKQIAVVNADADAVGKNVGQHARLRVEAQLAEAAIRAGLNPETIKASANYKQLGDAAEAAALKLAKAQIRDQIKFDRETLGFSPEDLQIAQALRQVYPDITERMNSTEAAAMRLNNELRAGRDIVAGFGNDLFSGLMRGEDAMKALTGAASNLVQKLGSANLNRFLQGGDFFGKQNLNSAQGAIGIASAGLSGYQSGNALTGALGGAMAGAAFGPAGMAIGGIAGLIGGILGADAKQKEALKRAKAEWEAAGPAFQSFLKQMTGGVQGNLAAQFERAYAQGEELARKAQAAKDYDAVLKLQKAYNENVIRESLQFVSTFNATLQGLTDGLGQDSPFLRAVENVKSQLASMRAFIDDAKTANKYTGQGDVDSATTAAQKFLLTLLQSPPALSAVQTGLQNIKGTATALQGALETLGLSSADAAAAINSGVAMAVGKLAATFTDGLQREINEGLGKGYLNNVADLVAKRSAAISDAAALGTSTDLIDRWFSVQAQKIVDDAGLMGNAFDGLLTQFPQFVDIVHESTSALEEAAEAQKKNIIAIKQFIDQIGKTIQDYLAGLRTGASSTLSPQDRLNAAQSQFNAQFALAQTGDRTALGTITQYSQTLLDAAKGFFASSSGYTSIFNDVSAKLQSIPENLTASQVLSSDQIIAAIQSGAANTITAVQGATTAVNTTGASNDNLTAAQSALIAAQNALAAQQITYLQTQANLLDAIRGLNSTAADQLVQLKNLNNTQTTVAVGGVGTVITANNSIISALNKIAVNTAYQFKSGGDALYLVGSFQKGGMIPGYANGGMVGNGIWNRDSVLARYAGGGAIGLAGGEYVMPAPQTRQFMPQLDAMRSGRGSNDNGISRADIVQLAKVFAAGSSQQIETLRALIGDLVAETRRGNDVARRTSNEPRRQGANR